MNKENMKIAQTDTSKTYASIGMLFGVMVGSAFGFLIGLQTNIAYAPIGTAIGMNIGMLIGYSIKRK